MEEANIRVTHSVSVTAARDFDFDSVAEVRRSSPVLRDGHTLDKGDLFPREQPK